LELLSALPLDPFFILEPKILDVNFFLCRSLWSSFRFLGLLLSFPWLAAPFEQIILVLGWVRELHLLGGFLILALRRKEIHIVLGQVRRVGDFP